jgi:hypothetical protein
MRQFARYNPTSLRNTVISFDALGGLPHTVGHYVDLGSAALGITLFPIGYFLDALAARRA